MIPPELGEIDVTLEKVIELMDAHDVERAATYDPFCVNLDKVRTHLFDESGFRIVKFEVSNGSGLTSYHPPVPLDGEIMDEAYACHAARGDIFVIDIRR